MNHFFSRTRTLLAASLLAAAASVNAGSLVILNAAHSHNSDSSSSSNAPAAAPTMIPVDQFARVLVYGEARNWYTADGRVLICPLEFTAESKKQCYKEDDKTKASRWVYFEGYQHLPGFEVSGVNYNVGRYERYLVVYFRKKN